MKRKKGFISYAYLGGGAHRNKMSTPKWWSDLQSFTKPVWTKGNTFVEKWQDWRKRVLSFLGSKVWEGKYTRELEVDKGYLVKFICAGHLTLTLWLLHGCKTPRGWGIYGQPHFSEVSALSQIREAPRSLLSASVRSQWSPAQNNPGTKGAYFGAAYSAPLQLPLTWVEHLSDP